MAWLETLTWKLRGTELQGMADNVAVLVGEYDNRITLYSF